MRPSDFARTSRAGPSVSPNSDIAKIPSGPGLTKDRGPPVASYLELQVRARAVLLLGSETRNIEKSPVRRPGPTRARDEARCALQVSPRTAGVGFLLRSVTASGRGTPTSFSREEPGRLPQAEWHQRVLVDRSGRPNSQAGSCRNGHYPIPCRYHLRRTHEAPTPGRDRDKRDSTAGSWNSAS